MPAVSLEAVPSLWLALTIPAVVLLWVLRPRRPRLRVPSLLLWTASPAERQAARPWQRLKNHPLLWLQLVAAALLTLAAARPFLPAEDAARHLVVLLDASGSMRAHDQVPDRFSSAKAAVFDLARRLGPDQELAVVRLDEQPRLLVAGAHNLAEVEAALANEEPSYGPPDVGAGLALATGLTQGPAAWVLVSDGVLALPEGARRPAGTSFRFIQVGSSAANVAVTVLSMRQTASELVVQAGLRNTGPNAVTGTVQLSAEGRDVAGARDWQLEAGSETFVTWSHVPAGARWFEARLVGVPPASNALDADDRAWAAPPVSGNEARLLLVTDGNTFLERALRVDENARGFHVAPADWRGVAAQDTAYPLTIVDRVWPETLPSGNALVVGPPLGDTFRPQQVWPRPDHPLLRYVDWSDVRVGAARKLPLDSTWETVIDSDGGPLLAIRADGSRRQAVLAFDLSQSDLALRPAFPVLLANLLEWLLPRPEAAPQSLSPGTAATIAPVPLADQAWAESMDGKRVADLAPPWPPRPFRPPAPGVYRVVQTGQGMTQDQLIVADGYAAAEADLTPRVLDLPAADGAVSSVARNALLLWPWLVGAVLLLSLVEWWVDARGR